MTNVVFMRKVHVLLDHPSYIHSQIWVIRNTENYKDVNPFLTCVHRMKKKMSCCKVTCSKACQLTATRFGQFAIGLLYRSCFVRVRHHNRIMIVCILLLEKECCEVLFISIVTDRFISETSNLFIQNHISLVISLLKKENGSIKGILLLLDV